MNTIEKYYQQIINDLKNNKRAIHKIEQIDIDLITEEFESFYQKVKSLNEKEIKEQLEKFYCVLTNTQTTSSKFHQAILNSFEIISKLKEKDEMVIFFLSSIQKQVIDHAQKTGNLINLQFFDILKKLLENKNPEILEWTLRTIESLGPQSLMFKNEILKLKPSLLKLFNEHQNNSFMIVDLIKKNWEKLKNERR